MEWVFKQDVKPATQKLLLLTLAYHVNTKGLCWPSVATLERETGLNRKTIIDGIKALVRSGLIIEAEERAGSTGRVKVYRWGGNYGDEAVPKTGQLNSTDLGDNSTGNGTVKQYRFYAETVPILRGNSTENGTQNSKGTVKEYIPLTPNGGKANDEQESEWTPGNPEPDPLAGSRPSRQSQPFLTKSQSQEQNKRRAQVFGWIYTAVNGQEMQGTPAPGTLKKYEEALDWFLTNSITPEQICHAVTAAKSTWRNIENKSVAINPKSIANNWHALYTPPKPSTAAAPKHAPIQFDLNKPLMGLSRKAFIDHFAHWTQIQRWEVFEAWAKERPDMLDHAIHARELATAVEKAIAFGKDRYTVEPDPKGLELEF